ncbi:nucleobase transporter [Leptomonas pyrrhocoris]|uniref:Nucleobase transporter n=1 Tax=Leptomonas pyrrhocoris TaxID=157538 RepID=A0A0M9FUU2_LEPPY|nr:nucleobase transporter [Leptomonas pyrrhocoris]KPA76407.1 nucleobase transporter [Leptomonas pyrrhocoris]|eukprot:XP_015654846.1 nucleobase transporter [Leptomonas pyrrhocoris]
MGCICGFSSFAEVYVYMTCILLGISMLMPVNALTSAPSYVMNYYKYVTGNEHATPNSPVFWANILTFYNLASVVTQAICGPTVLTPWSRKLSLTLRFTLALSLMMLELLVILVMPTGHVSQTGAMVSFFIVTIAAGAGKSYEEATCYALVGTMPPKFMSAIMFGCGLSGVIASILQCIIKASMKDDYDSTLHQAYIYFSLALAFMTVALTMALSLRWNSYAQEKVGEFRALRRAQHQQEEEGTQEKDAQAVRNAELHALDEGVRDTSDERQPYYGEATAAQPTGEVYGNIVMDDKNKEEKLRNKAAGIDGSDEGTEDDEVRVVRGDAVADGDDDSSFDDRNLTTSQQMQRTKAWPVMKMIWPVMLACFINFFVSLFIFPSLIIPIDREDKWFATIAILLYNCGDASGRFSSSLRFLWPSRKVLLIGSSCRSIFIPLTFLCIYNYIPGHPAPYVFMALLGLTNGFFGASAMVLGPMDSRLRTEGQRVMAGQLMGVALLCGASVSALLALLVVLFIP